MWEPKMNPKMNGSNQKTRVSGRYLYKAQRDHQLFSSRRFHQNIVCKAGAQLSDFFPVATLGLQDWGSSHTPNRRCPLPVAPPIPARCLPVEGLPSGPLDGLYHIPAHRQVAKASPGPGLQEGLVQQHFAWCPAIGDWGRIPVVSSENHQDKNRRSAATIYQPKLISFPARPLRAHLVP